MTAVTRTTRLTPRHAAPAALDALLALYGDARVMALHPEVAR
jgi:hypothetical protein